MDLALLILAGADVWLIYDEDCRGDGAGSRFGPNPFRDGSGEGDGSGRGGGSLGGPTMGNGSGNGNGNGSGNGNSNGSGAGPYPFLGGGTGFASGDGTGSSLCGFLFRDEYGWELTWGVEER